MRGRRGDGRTGMGLFSTLTEGIGIALDSLRGNKVRSGLTILGVTIGVLVVMIMAAVIQGVNQSFTELISSRGPTTFYVSHAQMEAQVSTGLEEEEPDFFKRDPVDPGWAAELARLPGIRTAEPVADLSMLPYEAVWRSQRAQVTLAAVGPDFMEIDNGDIVDGRFFTATEDERRTPVVVIDTAVANDLFEGLDPIGRTIRIGQVQGRQSAFRVVGVYSPPANLFAGIATHYLLLPFSSADKYLNVWDRFVSLVVRPEPGTQLPEAVDVVHARMRQLRGLRPGEPDDFAILTQDEIFSLWNNLTSVLFSAMIALSGVALMVGGVGVIGIMMISVTERTREIGIRKAMGARRRDLLWQFLVEAGTMTVLGGGTGLALGGFLVYALNTWTPLPAEVPLWSIVAALVASAFTGIGFGLYPAARGARLDPVEALRYE
ncbi:MAG: ABC transporter permease [Gemmatimonadota bacterium]